jgi:hypothetical protein
MPDRWIQRAAKKMKEKGTVGSLTAAANRRGITAMQLARHIKTHPEDFSPEMRKKANFAINANK